MTEEEVLKLFSTPIPVGIRKMSAASQPADRMEIYYPREHLKHQYYLVYTPLGAACLEGDSLYENMKSNPSLTLRDALLTYLDLRLDKIRETLDDTQTIRDNRLWEAVREEKRRFDRVKSELTCDSPIAAALKAITYKELSGYIPWIGSKERSLYQSCYDRVNMPERTPPVSPGDGHEFVTL